MPYASYQPNKGCILNNFEFNTVRNKKSVALKKKMIDLGIEYSNKRNINSNYLPHVLAERLLNDPILNLGLDFYFGFGKIF